VPGPPQAHTRRHAGQARRSPTANGGRDAGGRVMLAVLELPQPVIAAINGGAIAIARLRPYRSQTRGVLVLVSPATRRAAACTRMRCTARSSLPLGRRRTVACPGRSPNPTRSRRRRTVSLEVLLTAGPRSRSSSSRCTAMARPRTPRRSPLRLARDVPHVPSATGRSARRRSENDDSRTSPTALRRRRKLSNADAFRSLHDPVTLPVASSGQRASPTGRSAAMPVRSAGGRRPRRRRRAPDSFQTAGGLGGLLCPC
jgi:hypothetical protein